MLHTESKLEGKISSCVQKKHLFYKLMQLKSASKNISAKYKSITKLS